LLNWQTNRASHGLVDATIEGSVKPVVILVDDPECVADRALNLRLDRA
jgi:hypothetical protein